MGNMRIWGTWKHGEHGNMGNMETWGTWEHEDMGYIGNMGNMRVWGTWGTWKHGEHGDMGTWGAWEPCVLCSWLPLSPSTGTCQQEHLMNHPDTTHTRRVCKPHPLYSHTCWCVSHTHCTHTHAGGLQWRTGLKQVHMLYRWKCT